MQNTILLKYSKKDILNSLQLYFTERYILKFGDNDIFKLELQHKLTDPEGNSQCGFSGVRLGAKAGFAFAG